MFFVFVILFPVVFEVNYHLMNLILVYVIKDKLDIRKTLEEEARKCQWLVLWLDCDREGENIAYEVVEVCLNVNSRLNIWRARFSSLIDREIHQAAQQLARPNQLFSEAVDVRQEIDLRIGASFTRFQTMLLKDAFDFNFSTDGRNLILSYGPCQFPTLGFVVERYWEIQAHEPEELWKIQCSHTTDEGTANFNWMRGHLFDYTCAVLLYEMCVEESTATVTKVKKQEKLKYPPHPLNTIELEKRASRYFRMSSEQTMKSAEDLYQSGFISYPRTETDSFSTRTDLHVGILLLNLNHDPSSVMCHS
ncbi:putative DNA topoisomerase [Helianthus anomalus]